MKLWPTWRTWKPRPHPHVNGTIDRRQEPSSLLPVRIVCHDCHAKLAAQPWFAEVNMMYTVLHPAPPRRVNPRLSSRALP